MTRARRLFWWSLGAAYVATWVVISWLTSPAFDAYGDMVENYAWSQSWSWGTFRHPPLFAWIVGVWFSVFPTRVWTYYVLSYLNAGAGVLGIVWLARLWLPEELSAARRDVFLTSAAIFAILSLSYSNLAAKFNADTVLLSLWPWTAYAFFASMRESDPRRRWRFTMLLAALAAAAMLGKYYSALLLASLFIASMSHGTFRRWYATPFPYAAAVVWLVLLLPHAFWEQRVGFPFRLYLEGKIDDRVDPVMMAVFLLSGIYYLPLSWLAWLILRRRFAAPETRRVAWAMPLRGLILLCVMPALITIAFNLFARVHLTTHWAIPIWFAVPVLLSCWLLPHIDDHFAWTRLRRGIVAFWVVLVAIAITYTVILSVNGDPRYSLARPQMVSAAESHFRARFPGRELAWVGGTWPETGGVAFFAANHPRALPGFPDDPRALVNPYADWRQRYGMILCVASNVHAREGSHNTACEGDARSWLRAHGLAIDVETLAYRAAGWRFVNPQPKNVTVFWVPPAGSAVARREHEMRLW